MNDLQKILSVALPLLYIVLFLIQNRQIKSLQNTVKSVMEVQFDMNEVIIEQERTIKYTLDSVLIFQKHNRIPICQLIIDDCIKNQDYEMAQYWENYKNEAIKQAKEQK